MFLEHGSNIFIKSFILLLSFPFDKFVWAGVYSVQVSFICILLYDFVIIKISFTFNLPLGHGDMILPIKIDFTNLI